MSKKKRNPEDLSIDELRQLLINKHRSQKSELLSYFRQTGRAIRLKNETQEDFSTKENDRFWARTGF